MKRVARLGIVILLLLMFGGATPQAHAVTNQSLAVPLYAKPGATSFWDDVRNAGSNSVPFVIANPSNGPGSTADPAYVAGIAKNDAASVRTLGYIQTNYQARPFKESYNDIDAWYRMYPSTKGIFIGLIKEGGASEACYVAGLYNHIKNIRPNDLVVLGAGTHMSSKYEPYGDIFLNAETDYVSYQTGWKAQYRGFEDKADYQNRFWHVVYGVSSDRYDSAFEAVRNNNAGWMYITDKTTPTPYNATPSYWQNEANDISALPASAIPNRGKTTLPRGCISLSASADSTIDTTVSKQTTTKSVVTISNTNSMYDSEPLTSLQFVNLPKGAALTAMAASDWSCTLDTKTCKYEKVLAASTSVSPVGTTLSAGCDYAGGDALLRLTNYAGNRWDVKIPMRPPVGCDASTSAGKLNASASGQITTLTTQSVETTPAITPLGGDEKQPKSTSEKAVQTSLSPIKITAIIVLGIIVVSLATWGILAWTRRRRYRVSP